MAKEVRLEMNCDYCGHCYLITAINHYAIRTGKSKVFLDSFN